MVQLFLLLLGGRLLRRRWWVLGFLGLVWMALGVFFSVNAFIDEVRIPLTFFAALLLIDAGLTLIAVVAFKRARMLRFGKALVFIIVAVLLIALPRHSSMAVGLIVGTFMCVDGFWRGGSAIVVRIPGWRMSLAKAIFQFTMGVWSLSPWPTNYAGEVESDVGMLLIISALGVLGFALRLRHMPPETTLSSIASTGWPALPTAADVIAGPEEAPEALRARETATVHVWTPTGALPALHHGMQRYIAAVDEQGNISTGHSALELPPSLYISHYPGVEIDRAPSDFARVLRATKENDVPGRFQPSYQEESAGWCPSSFQVPIPNVDGRALRAFWALYRQDPTYNLTNRNCSSAVVKALDAGLEGVFEDAARSPIFVLRLLMSPELMLAGMLRQRATTMAWTPGLVLDYVRALSGILAQQRPMGQ
ncbi:protease [Aquabacter sp. CN5-332]|uniref:HdeD family acid-resistance protein n=1 Tax=Aquabacter sp. CN5-332 TaxID=3156608 RepID=UPI0032B50B0B